MRIAGWVGAGLLTLGLTVFAVQNTAPSLPLVILGFRTPMLPLAVWLLGATGLGALTTSLFIGVSGKPGTTSAPGNRRRWQVHPAEPAHRPPPRRDPDPRQRSEPGRPPRNFDYAARPRPNGQPQEDWEGWGQRSPVSQWQDWDQAPQESDRPIPKRQQQAQAQATEAFEDIATGWDDRAADSPYRPGVSPVDDALDEIAEGWEDWDDPEAARRDNAPESRPIYEVRRSPESVAKAGSSYSYRYRSADDLQRRPPSDDAAVEPDAGPDGWDNDSNRPNEPEVGPDGVYDADYRVIIPPSRPLEADPDLEGDRP